MATESEIRFQFNERKATAAAAYLIGRIGRSVGRLKLMKLLYMAERESLKQFDRPMIGDAYYSLPRGPILSRTLNLMKKPEDGEGFWQEHLAAEGFNVVLRKDPGIAELCDADIQILDHLLATFKDWHGNALAELTHEEFPEWQDPRGSQLPIETRRLLRLLGKTDEEIEESGADAADSERLATRDP